MCHLSYSQISAQFSVSKTVGCGNTEIEIDDQSSGNITQWEWNFGNGVTKLETEPQSYKFVYSPGTYTITLTVSDGIITETKSIDLTINELPTPDFEFDAKDGCVHSDVEFTNKSKSPKNITDYLWIFGDGGVSSEENPTYQYINQGLYTVQLTVTDEDGCKATAEKEHAVEITEPLDMSFEATVTEACHSPLTTSFSPEKSTEVGVSYLWNFGDGETSTEENPSHTYKNDGMYSVSLTTQTRTGCSSKVEINNLVKINYAIVNIQEENVICMNMPSKFVAVGNTSINTYTWDFGDNTTEQPVSDSIIHHIFQKSGTYTIILKARTNSGCEVIQKKNVIVLAAPMIDFTVDKNHWCKDDKIKVEFTTSDNSDIVSYEWNFGDGETEKNTAKSVAHQYSVAQNYDVALSVTNSLGCVGHIAKPNCIEVNGPVAQTKMPTQHCMNYSIKIENASELKSGYISSWEYLYDTDAVESAKTENEQQVAVTYKKEGDYPIKLKVTDGYGCSDEHIDTLYVGDGDSYRATIVSPVGKNAVFCKNDIIDFTAKETDGITQWQWKLTGVNTKHKIDTIVTTQNITMRLNIPDTYNLWLLPYRKTCPGRFENKKITINPPKSVFSYYPPTLCIFPDTIHFDPSESIGAESYLWDFGDGTSVSIIPLETAGHYKWVDPTTSDVLIADTTSFVAHHVYTSANDYTVKLTTFAGSCSDETTMVLNTSGIQMGISQDTLMACQGTEIKFVDTSKTSSGTITKRIWTFSNGGADDVQEIYEDSILRKFEKSGTYSVGLQVYSDNGCSNSVVYYDYLTILSNPSIKAFKNDDKATGCEENAVSFSVQVENAKQFIWFYGDGNSDTTNVSKSNSHLYLLGDYKASVKVIDVYDCESISDSVVISRTKPLPKIEIPTNLCYYDSLAPINNSDGVGLQYQWDWGDGTISNKENPRHLYSNGDKEYTVQVRLIDENGCDSSVTLSTHVRTLHSDFTASKTEFYCPPAEVSFTDLSEGENLKYNWFVDEQNVSSINVKNAYWQYQDAGSHDVSLIVTDEFGCVDTAFKPGFVSIHGPKGDFKVEQESGCTNTEITMTAFDIKDVTHYSWVFGDGQFKNTTTGVVTYTYPEGNVYTPSLTITDGQGCEMSFIGTPITIYGATLDFVGDTMQCEGKTVNFIDKSSAYPKSIDSWTWEFKKDETSQKINSQNAEVQLEAGVYDVILETQVGECVYTKERTNFLTVYEKPVVKILPENDVEMCDKSATELHAEIISGDDGKGPYKATGLWTGTIVEAGKDDFCSATFTANESEENLVAFDFVSSYGCNAQSATKKNFVVSAIPQKLNDLEMKYCQNDVASTSDLTSLISTSGNLTWYDSNLVKLASAPEVQTNSIGNTTYFISQTENNCESDKSKFVVSVMALPKPEITVDKEADCQGNPIKISLTESFVGQEWTCKPIDYLNSAKGSSVQLRDDAAPGVYVIGVVVEDENHCKNKLESTKQVTIYPIPEIDFSINPNPVEMLDMVNFENKIDTIKYKEPVVWTWTIGDFTTQEYNFPYIFNESGSFDITLEGYIKEECKNSLTIPLTVMPQVRVPNVFTPNGDGINDVFFEDMPDIELIIMNRWGQELYKGYEGWDGTYNGKEMTAGTYFYFITMPNGDTYNGPLMLIRN